MSSTKSMASQIITAAAISLTSLAIGYQLGSRSLGVGHTNNSAETPIDSASTKPTISQAEEESASGSEDEDEDDDDTLADGDLSAITAGFTEPCKLVLIVRTDLQMSPGKISAQCGHATLACYKALVKKNPKLVQHWERTGQAKIALKASSEDQLLELEAIAKSLNLCARSIHDAGRTEVAAGSRTVLGIGPAPVALINQVTGKLRLL